MIILTLAHSLIVTLSHRHKFPEPVVREEKRRENLQSTNNNIQLLNIFWAAVRL